jgi:alkylation response protein AidB-like acyl-CoA dehydrogenase
VEDPYQALSLYLVESGTDGFGRGRHLDKMGMWSQDTAELFFSKCRIPLRNRLGEKGGGFLMLMQKLQQERLVCAVAAVASAERVVEWTTQYCRENQIGDRPISKFQAAQFALVEMATDIKLGRSFVDKLVMASRAMDLVGDYATLEKCPLARAFRDAKVMTIFAGTNEIMKGIAAKFMGL